MYRTLREDGSTELSKLLTRNLSHEAAAGITYVALSVVEPDRLSESGYFRAKNRSGKPDQDLLDPVLHHPRDTVLRVPQGACRHFFEGGEVCICRLQHLGRWLPTMLRVG